MQAICQENIFVLDFEGSKKTGVIECGVVHICQNEIVKVYSNLYTPRDKISKKDFLLHKISNETLANKKPFELEFERFLQMRKNGVFCAHSSNVEEAFLNMTWQSCANVSNFCGKITNTWSPFLDTRFLYQNIYPDLPSYKLADLIKIFDFQQKLDIQAKKLCPKNRCSYHSALYDALASAILLINLFTLKGFEKADLIWFLAHSFASKKKKEDFLQQNL